MPRIRLDLLAQPRHVHVHGAGGRHRVVAPHFVQQLFAGQGRAAMLDEVLEQLKLARGQLERRAVPASLPRFGNRRGRRRTDSPSAGCGRRRRAAELGLDAREQLDHLERLRHVVVGAELEADDLVDDLARAR